MDENSDSGLESILKDYASRLKRKEVKEASESEFTKIKKAIILPFMNEVSRKLTKYGHKARTVEDDELYSGYERGENVTLYLSPAGKAGAWYRHNRSSVSFTCKKGSKTIEVYRNMVKDDQAAGGLVKTIDIRLIGREEVQALVLHFVREVLE